MPLFAYRCPTCGHEAEYLEWKASASYERPCPACGVAMQRVLTAANFTIKGFSYANGYGHSQEHK